MEEKIKKTLEQSGLGQKEMQIYLAVLELGSGTITDISKKSKLKRATIYLYIDLLTKQNLLLKTIRGKRIYYLATDPKKLIRLMESRKKEVEKFLPQLEKMHAKLSHKPQIRFYEGIDGLREIYQEMTSTSHTVYGAFSADKYYELFSKKDNAKLFQNLKQSGGQIKDLIEDTARGKKHAKSELYKGVGITKFLPKDFNLAVDLIVAGDKVAMISLVNLIGIIIENPEIADLQRNFLKFMRKN